MGQSSNDIDKILNDIKKRRGDMASSSAEKPTSVGDLTSEILQKKADKAMELQKSSAEKPTPVGDLTSEILQKKADKASELQKSSAEKPTQPSPAISPDNAKKIQEFINPPTDDTAKKQSDKFSEQMDEIISGRKADDYVDENFRQFFTQPVVVTKPPEKTNVEIKHKKNGLFKRKYITDSLSLNLPDGKNMEKAAPMPLVKTAGDVWADSFKGEEEYNSSITLSKGRGGKNKKNKTISDEAKPSVDSMGKSSSDEAKSSVANAENSTGDNFTDMGESSAVKKEKLSLKDRLFKNRHADDQIVSQPSSPALKKANTASATALAEKEAVAPSNRQGDDLTGTPNPSMGDDTGYSRSPLTEKEAKVNSVLSRIADERQDDDLTGTPNPSMGDDAGYSRSPLTEKEAKVNSVLNRISDERQQQSSMQNSPLSSQKTAPDFSDKNTRILSQREQAVNKIINELSSQSALAYRERVLHSGPPPIDQGINTVYQASQRASSAPEYDISTSLEQGTASSLEQNKASSLEQGTSSTPHQSTVSAPEQSTVTAPEQSTVSAPEQGTSSSPQEDIGAQKVSENQMINTIFTSVIERQAQEALTKDEMTGVILPPKTAEKISGSDEEQAILPQEEEEKPVFEEYTSKSEFLDRLDDDSEDILSELKDFKSTLSMRIILGLVCGAALFYLNLATTVKLPLPPFISPLSQPMMFYVANAIIFALVILGFLPTVISGFTSLKGAPAPDSLVSLAVVMGALQLFVMIIRAGYIDVAKTTIFAGFIAFALSFNAIGKKISTNTIIKNLSLSATPDGINAGYIITDTDAVKRLSRSLDEKLPQILVSRKTGVITNFVSSGFSIHKSDYWAKNTAIATYIVTGVCFVMGLIISKNPVSAFCCAAGAAALQIPLSQTLVSSIPSALMQKSLEQVGALVNGWKGIDQLSKTTHVSFDAKHLFPKGTVILHGIKTFEKERIDLAIIYAASVLIEKCEVLKPVFMEVIEGKTDILYPVENCEYIQCQGYVSWIQNNRVIIGNRTLMEKYDISMPPLTLEAGFINQGRKPVYLAVGGKLFGMFVLSYSGDEIVKENLDKLISKGVNIILTSSDFNIDASLVEKIYHIPTDTVQVLNQNESTLLSSFTDYSITSEACVAHLDSLHSLVCGFCGAESARTAETICAVIQTVSVAIGAILALIFTYSQTLSHLPLPSILLLSFGWMGLSIMGAFAKKY